MARMGVKLWTALLLAAFMCLNASCALGCTSIYVGSDLTEDGSTIFGRSEDASNSYNKLYYVSPAGNHKAGEAYKGCYGFEYEFTRDSYAYTAFSDDNREGVGGVCPDCGGTHAHTPYEAAGTNEMGVTVSATETLHGSAEVCAVDPYADAGIEEAEIVTVLLSESSSAREAVELLLSIYDGAGCAGGAGLFIADDSEAWYIENLTGHQYMALKLNPTLVFVEPNMSIIGLIDLDDSDNVIASKGIIETAQQAGTFVGDIEANTIDFTASYNAGQTANSRMVSALNYLQSEAPDEPEAADYAITNVDADGNIVPLNTAIMTDKLAISDVVDFYAIDGIGNARNLETHIFQVFGEDGPTDTVEWVAMDDGRYNVFVSYYPMLTTDTYAGYQLSTAVATYEGELPEGATGYLDNADEPSYCVLPDNWYDSMYWSLDALSNIMETGDISDEQRARVKQELNELQDACYDAYAKLKAAVAAVDEATAARMATDISAQTAAEVHAAVVQLVNEIR